MPNPMGQVDAERSDGRAAGGGAADQDRPVPAEVTGPLVAARIEEPGALAGLGIDPCEVWTFRVVVREAREREIAGYPAPVLFGDHVIDLEGEFIVDVRHAAVFTTVVGAFPDQLGQSDVHGKSSTAARALEYLPSFRFQNGKNRADALEVDHLRVFFRRERPGARLGREFVHPAHVVLREGKPEDGPSDPRR
jgi:hypothetical protein